MKRSSAPSVLRNVKNKLADADKENLDPQANGKGGTTALGRRAVSGQASVLNQAFKCPLPGYVPSQAAARATLGPRKVLLVDCGFANLGIPTKITTPPEDPAEPLVLHEPDASAADTVRVVLDGFLSERMKPHQRDGVKFLFDCIGKGKDGFTGAILSDSMGLGKTFQSICVLWTLLTTGIHANATCSKALILCPASLVENWGEEIKKWLEDRLRPVIVKDTRAAAVKDALLSFGNSSVWGRHRAHVMVMGYHTFRLHASEINKKGIDFVICDEAHFLKNADSQIASAVANLPAKRRLLLSGTPIQNNLSEFYSMVNIACPDIVGSLAQFRKEYEKPILRSQDSGASAEEIKMGQQKAAALLEKCSSFLLRRTNDVIAKYLPPRNEQVIFAKMSSLQLALYKHFAESPQVIAATTPMSGSTALHTLPAITALKKLCSHPDLVYEICQKTVATQLSQDKQEDKRKVVMTGFEGAAHVFTGPTIFPAYKPGLCQSIHSGKVTVLEVLLKAVRANEPTDKVVVVSNFTEALDVLSVMCRQNSWSFLRLDGSLDTSKRQSLVHDFNNPEHPSFILLLSSKAGGTGLNIIGANRLVQFDPDWNPANDDQAMARVWRQGQTKRVWLYRLLTAGTIEEKVYQRQLAKKGLSAAVVDDLGANQEQRHFSADELRELFKVDPTAQCDTHAALRCPCDGSGMVRASAAAHDRMDLEQASSHDASAVGKDCGVLHWAHMDDPAKGIDPIWKKVSSWVRDKYISFFFSDHPVACPPEAGDDGSPMSKDSYPDSPAGLPPEPVFLESCEVCTEYWR